METCSRIISQFVLKRTNQKNCLQMHEIGAGQKAFELLAHNQTKKEQILKGFRTSWGRCWKSFFAGGCLPEGA